MASAVLAWAGWTSEIGDQGVIALCKGCSCETEADDGICPECYSPAHRIFGPRITELEAALRSLLHYVDRYQDQPTVAVAPEIMRARKALAT